MKKILSLIIALTMVISLSPFAFAGNESSLAFDENGEFKILVLSDTQDDQYPSDDMLNAVKLAIKESEPDLIVFTGDLVEDSKIGLFGDEKPFTEGVVVKKSGEVQHEETLTNLKKTADDVLSIFQSSGVPFVIAQGNNDHKCGVSNEEWLEIYSSYSNCIIRDESDDEDSRIDYNVFINDRSGNPVFNLWLIDTGRGGIRDDQIEWYKTESKKITSENGGTPIPAILFQHINTSDVGNLFEDCGMFDEGARSAGFMKFRRLNRNIAYGVDTICYDSCEASEEFKAWKECGDVIGAYFGHQHVDAFCGTIDGIEIGFNPGLEMEKLGPYGYRVITLREDDIKNYDNDLYLYEGKVALGTDRYEKYEEKGYREYNSVLEKFIYSVYNVFVILDNSVRELIA